MSIAEDSFSPTPDFPGAGTRAAESAAARLRCIEVAIKKGFEPKDDWADWLREGVKVIEGGGIVTTEWLEEFDRQNAYI